ncbi:hypothetical protein GCM10010109_20580 [Actinoplanes campanulatus]|nr:hypothetical protein GCM10010109_20580 [Actinoplanes campanulatus]GID36574.1 hypothetical protein Aca09nite_30800 [Actinoplanes campanulatus]
MTARHSDRRNGWERRADRPAVSGNKPERQQAGWQQAGSGSRRGGSRPGAAAGGGGATGWACPATDLSPAGAAQAGAGSEIARADGTAQVGWDGDTRTRRKNWQRNADLDHQRF